MSPIIIRGLMTAGGLSLGGIGAWQLNEHLKPRTIGQRLLRDGVSLLGFGDDQLSEWKKLAKKYGETTTSSTGDKFTGLEISTPTETDDNGKKLMNKCREVFNKDLGGNDYDSDVSKLKKWCVVGISSTSPTEAA